MKFAHINLQRPGREVFDWQTDSSPLSVVTMLSEHSGGTPPIGCRANPPWDRRACLLKPS